MTDTTRKVQLLDLKAQYSSLRSELLSAMEAVMESGQYVMGPYVKKFEESIQAYCGVKHAISVANGTDALLLTLDALGVGPGDEVITSPFTFFASAEVISQVGATPVFVDIDPQTYNLDVTRLEEAITLNTKAIIPVHIFGQPADMDEINRIAKDHKLYVIEDACQAIGSEYKGQKIGTLADAGCFSFFPTKNLGGYGDGGIITTNNDELAAKLRILRVHGSNPKYYHSMIGYNSRLDPIQAAMLEVKLSRLDEWNHARREKAAVYDEALKDLPLQLPMIQDNVKTVYHLYIIQTDRRDQLIEFMKARGIDTGIYYPVPLHRQTVYLDLGYGEGSMPVAEAAALGTMAIPLYPELSDQDQAYVIDVINDFFDKEV